MSPPASSFIASAVLWRDERLCRSVKTQINHTDVHLVFAALKYIRTIDPGSTYTERAFSYDTTRMHLRWTRYCLRFRLLPPTTPHPARPHLTTHLGSHNFAQTVWAVQTRRSQSRLFVGTKLKRLRVLTTWRGYWMECIRNVHGERGVQLRRLHS